MKARDWAQARTAWTRLQELAKDHPGAQRQARLLGAELALAQPDAGAARALALLAPLQKDVSRAVALMTSQAQIATGQNAPAAQALQLWVAEHPGDALAWQQLAAANRAQQQLVAAIRAEAEANVAQLDYSAALQRLKAAQELARQRRLPEEHFEASIVDTRIRQLEQLVREQALER
jgi:predicted Zn-dependent protease